MSSKYILNIYKKFRKWVVTALILAELVLSSFIYFESTAYFGMYDICEISITFILIFYIFMISNDLEEYEDNELEEEFLSSIGPYSLIYIKIDGEIKVLKGNIESLSISKNIDINNLKDLFSTKEWGKIEYIASQPSTGHQMASGVISFIDAHNQIRHLRYIARLIKSHKLDGLLIWFLDDSDVKAEALNLMQLFHKYRIMSYELDIIMNNLPIPIWRRESGGKIIYYNQAYKDLLYKMGYSHFYNNISELDETPYAQLLKEGIKESTLKKVVILDNQPVILRIHEALTLDKGSIGYCLFMNELDDLHKKLLSQTNTIEQILKMNHNAILVINNLGQVAYYNEAFITIFELDQEIISQNLSFSSLIDHMKEKGKLPEVKNYKEFKLQQMQYISEYHDPKYFLMHLTDGKTLRVSITPIQGGDTIFSYEDISEQLQLERNYQQQQALIKNLIASYESPIVIFGGNGRLYLHNNKFEQVFQLKLVSENPHFIEVCGIQEKFFKNHKQYTQYQSTLTHAIDFKSSAVIALELNNNMKFSVYIEPLTDDYIIVKYLNYISS